MQQARINRSEGCDLPGIPIVCSFCHPVAKRAYPNTYLPGSILNATNRIPKNLTNITSAYLFSAAMHSSMVGTCRSVFRRRPPFTLVPNAVEKCTIEIMAATWKGCKTTFVGSASIYLPMVCTGFFKFDPGKTFTT
jgi:hypothetical protein